MNENYRTNLVSKFVCVAENCPDTCCKHWSMQVDLETAEKYQAVAPELFSAIEADISGDYIMRKNPQTTCCVKFENGRCGIQQKYGEEMLGDACALYPRITRKIGDATIMTATMSCPEIARIALYDEQPFVFAQAEIKRIPQEIKNVLPDEISVADALTIHCAFIAATEDENVSAEHVFLRIYSAAKSLEFIAKKDWVNAAPMYLRLADGRIPKAEKNINDPFNLLHALCGLIVASKKSAPPRLAQTISEIEIALNAKIDWENVSIKTHDDSLKKYDDLQKNWNENLQKIYAPIFKRWLSAQLSAAFFPFAGLGQNLSERVTIIGVRMAIFRLAIMSAYGTHEGVLHQDDVVRVVQSLSRFLDHLADPSFFLQICEETRWNKESRIGGLLV